MCPGIILSISLIVTSLSILCTLFLNKFLKKCENTKGTKDIYKYSAWFSTFSFIISIIMSIFNWLSIIYSWSQAIDYYFLGFPTIANVIATIMYGYCLLCILIGIIQI